MAKSVKKPIYTHIVIFTIDGARDNENEAQALVVSCQTCLVVKNNPNPPPPSPPCTDPIPGLIQIWVSGTSGLLAKVNPPPVRVCLIMEFETQADRDLFKTWLTDTGHPKYKAIIAKHKKFISRKDVINGDLNGQFSFELHS